MLWLLLTTELTQSPWLRKRGVKTGRYPSVPSMVAGWNPRVLNVAQPSFLHWSLLVGTALSDTTRLALTSPP